MQEMAPSSKIQRNVHLLNLDARPELPTRNGTAGLQNLQVGHNRGALLYAPESAVRESAAPLAVMLRIDAARIALGGFSDGASYALSLGFGNGRLFRYIWRFHLVLCRPHGARGAAEGFYFTRDA
jgi:hypothetical protein